MLDWHTCQICYPLEIKLLILLLLLLCFICVLILYDVRYVNIHRSNAMHTLNSLDCSMIPLAL